MADRTSAVRGPTSKASSEPSAASIAWRYITGIFVVLVMAGKARQWLNGTPPPAVASLSAVASAASSTIEPPRLPVVARRSEIPDVRRVDVEKYLLVALSDSYLEWATAASEEPATLYQRALVARSRAIRLAEHVKSSGLDPVLAQMWEDYAQTMGEIGDALVEQRFVDAEVARRIQSAVAEGKQRVAAQVVGATAASFATGTPAPALMSMFSVNREVGRTRDEADRIRSEQAERRTRLQLELQRRLSDRLARGEARATTVAEKKAWVVESTGWFGISEVYRRLESADPSTVADTWMAVMADRSVSVPDSVATPGLVAVSGILAEDNPSSDLQTMVLKACAAADVLIAAERRVPDGAAFRHDRACLLMAAASLLGYASQGEVHGQDFLAQASPIALQAVEIADRSVGLHPSVFAHVPSAVAPVALAYARAGQPDAAMVCWAALSEDEVDPLDAAALLASKGKPVEARQFVAKLLATADKSGIGWAREHPALRRLRDLDAEAFDRLFRPQVHGWLDAGLLSNDFLLVNDSPFPITGVKLVVTATTNKGACHADTLTIDRIEPGATHRWTNVFRGTSVKASAKPTTTFTTVCDQD